MTTKPHTTNTLEAFWFDDFRTYREDWFRWACRLLQLVEPQPYSGGCWIVRETRKNEVVDYSRVANVREHSFACGFCRKRVGLWKKGTRKTEAWSMMSKALREHASYCAMPWLVRVTASFYARLSSPAVTTAVAQWLTWIDEERRKHDRSPFYHCAPRGWVEWLTTQPHPPGSEMAQAVEIMLVSCYEWFTEGKSTFYKKRSGDAAGTEARE